MFLSNQKSGVGGQNTEWEDAETNDLLFFTHVLLTTGFLLPAPFHDHLFFSWDTWGRYSTL